MTPGEHIIMQALKRRSNVEGLNEDGLGSATKQRRRRKEVSGSYNEVMSVIHP